MVGPILPGGISALSYQRLLPLLLVLSGGAACLAKDNSLESNTSFGRQVRCRVLLSAGIFDAGADSAVAGELQNHFQKKALAEHAKAF
jgi:hypothetical protein